MLFLRGEIFLAPGAKILTTLDPQEKGPLSTQNLFNLLHIHRSQAKKLLEALKIFFSYQVLIFFNIFY